jgi:hypothetical protein
MSWQSVGLVNVDGIFYSVTATLDPAHLADDVGTMSIMGNQLGGMYTAQLDAYLQVVFTPQQDPDSFEVFVPLRLDNPNGTWVGKPSSIPNEVHFDPSVTVYNIDNGMGQLNLDPVPTPEPGTLVLVSSAALAMLVRMKAQRR